MKKKNRIVYRVGHITDSHGMTEWWPMPSHEIFPSEKKSVPALKMRVKLTFTSGNMFEGGIPRIGYDFGGDWR